MKGHFSYLGKALSSKYADLGNFANILNFELISFEDVVLLSITLTVQHFPNQILPNKVTGCPTKLEGRL